MPRQRPLAGAAKAPMVGVATPLAGATVGLARGRSREDVHQATKRAAVEGSQRAAPNRGRLQGRLFHTLAEDVRSERVPLDIQRSFGSEAEPFERGLHSKVEESDA